MKKGWMVKWMVLALVLALVPVMAVAAQGDPGRQPSPPGRAEQPPQSGEFEADDDTPGTAIELQCGWSYDGSIDFPGDVDYFYTDFGGGEPLAGIINAWRLGTGLDPTLSLYAPDGTTALGYIDDFDGFDSLLHHTDLLGSGRYYWAVRGFADFSTGDYTFRVDNRVYVTAQAGGKVDGIKYSQGDVLAYNQCADTWEMFLDVSDMGLNNVTDIAVIPNWRSVLMTVSRQNSRYNGPLSPHDVYAAWIGQVGEDTEAYFERFIDGSDVGLTTAGEALDGVLIKQNGNVAVSIKGEGNVPGVGAFDDEDIIEFSATTVWEDTTGTWAMAFDGSDEGLRGVDALGIYMNDYWLDQLIVFDKPVTRNGSTFGKSSVGLCWPLSLGEDTFCQNWWEVFDAVDAGMPAKVKLAGFDQGSPAVPFWVFSTAARLPATGK